MTTGNAEAEKRLKQLIYRANHRGIKEMDIILGEFARDRLATLNADEIETFEALMAENDRDLLSWFTSETPLPARHDTSLYRSILAYHADKAR
ncbi:MAG: succinate dehydrogenase assembly factor 2 [Salaquimonas sp.]|jgi:antitoxin CptB|nr:succinate dehydrogenase assembly factor 2 [Salaquimonas sp.]